MTTLEEFVAGLPKAELHLHIEGSLEPEQMFEFARRNNVELSFGSVEEIRAAYSFDNLQAFLDLYYQGMSVLQTRRDFYELTMAYMRRVHADNCRHVEIFFDPQGHTERGVAFEDVIEGILDALRDAEDMLGVSSHLIMSFLRHLSEDAAFETWVSARPYLDRILGVGLDSSEVGHPPSKFERVFAQAREMGMKSFAHAGEEGPPDYVWQALDLLRIDRLDHGNRALEDDRLVGRLVSEGITLTVCPLSNLKLCVVNDLAQHPLKRMLELGLQATVNSDDPSYFGGYLNDNYLTIARALNLDKADLAQLARNSIEGAYLDEARRQELLVELNAYVAVR